MNDGDEATRDDIWHLILTWRAAEPGSDALAAADKLSSFIVGALDRARRAGRREAAAIADAHVLKARRAFARGKGNDIYDGAEAMASIIRDRILSDTPAPEEGDR